MNTTTIDLSNFKPNAPMVYAPVQAAAYRHGYQDAVASVRAALAAREGQQESVATVSDRYSRGGYNDEIDVLMPVGTKLYAAPVAQQSEALDEQEEHQATVDSLVANFNEMRTQRDELLRQLSDVRNRLAAQQSEVGEQDRRALELANAALIAAQPRDITPKGWERHEAAINATGCALHKPTEAGAPTAPALPENWKNDVLTAWRCVRKYNNTIPDATLDLMRDMLLAAPTSGREAVPTAAAMPIKLENADTAPEGLSWTEAGSWVLGWNACREAMLAPTAGRESAAPAAPVREGDGEQEAKALADGYESGFFASSPQDGDGQFTLHYKTAAQAEAAYMLVTGIIDAAMQKGASNG